MIDHTLDTASGVLIVRPKSALTGEDFTHLAQTVDPYLAGTGDLAGIVIDAPRFPGWRDLGAVVHHFRFVRDHHRHVQKVAVVTDSTLGDAAERLASHFVAAEIRHFPAGQLEAAQQWIKG